MDSVKFLREVWFLDRSYLALKLWHPLFDSKTEVMDKNLAWVEISGLPMEWWSIQGNINPIDDRINKTLMVDDSFKSCYAQMMTKLLVEVDM